MTLDSYIEKSGLKISAISDKTGIHEVTMRRYRDNPGMTPFCRVVRICEVLDITLEDFKKLTPKNK